jgi:hypothetical protein
MKITRIISLLICLPSFAYASPRVVTVEADQKAPFAGTLMNPAAISRIVAETEMARDECKLRESFVQDRERTRCDLTVSNVQASLDALTGRHTSVVDIKNDEIERLSKIALERPGKYNHWWFGGGVVIGVITSITIFYAAVEVSGVK